MNAIEIRSKIVHARTGDTVKVHFTCRFEAGTVFDSSVGREPLQFAVGKGQVIQGLEEAVIGMRQGESKTFRVTTHKAYGPYRKELVQVIARDRLPANVRPEIGRQLHIQRDDGLPGVATVTRICDKRVTLDANHPLAGKDLIFDIELVEILRDEQAAVDKYYRMGVELQNRGKFDEAISFYKKILELDPSHSDTYNILGSVLQGKGNIDEAMTCYQKALQSNPNSAMPYNNLGSAFRLKGRLDDAIAYYQKALQINPNFAEAFNNLGNALRDKRLPEEAISNYRKAIELKPHFADAHYNLSFALLLSGNFREGWNEYEWRWKLKNCSQYNLPQPVWDGAEIAGSTILLHTEQGVGDAIQFIRYAPLVAKRGARVLLGCQKELKTLFQNVEGVNQVIAYGEPSPVFDVYCPLLSLPRIFSTTLESVPAQIPYVSVGPALVRQWRGRVHTDGSKLNIGLAWAGSPGHLNDRNRSLSLDLFSPLSQTEGITFYSLQKGEAAQQAKNPPKGMKLVDYSGELHDFSDTAALIENLDLTISADTAVAHLAGALGRSVWTLLPFAPDWRWMLDREDSPWYPTMRLYRQPSPGEWTYVIERVRNELFILINNFKK